MSVAPSLQFRWIVPLVRHLSSVGSDIWSFISRVRTQWVLPTLRTMRSNQLFLARRQKRLDEKARRKALNEVAKTRIDLEVKDLKERGDTINKIMGQILEDMTKTSQERIEKYRKNPGEVEEEEETQNL